MSHPPAPTIAGYRILRKLGAGGMGTVWEARVVRARRRLRSGDRVVIKVLHSRFATDTSRVRAFKREAGIGMAIAHPNLVPVHELGTARTGGEGVPFLVMSHAEGRLLRELVALHPSESTVRHVGAQIAGALAALHSRGLIHRDLKPENIFVDENEKVTVVDYGLSVLVHGESDAVREESFAGTLAYAAPERLQPGARVGHSSDLFSLGVILYELATGTHPFRSAPREDLVCLLRAILERQPPYPSRRDASLSFFFDRLVMELIDKDPEQRLGPAASVQRILDQGENSGWWQRVVRTTASDVRAGKRALAVDRRTRMCGRDEELARLLQAAREAFRERRRRVALILGDSGAGKSRLVDELSEAMDRDGLRGFFLVGRTFSANVPLPFEAAVELVERAFGCGTLPLQRRVSLLSERLRGLLRLPEDQIEESARFLIGMARTEWSHGRAVALFRRFLASLAERSPGAVVLEGLHRAGRGTLALFADLATREPALPVLLVATARPRDAEAAEAESLARIIEEVEQCPDGMVLRLGPLRADDITLMLRDLGVPEVLHGSLVERLLAAVGGHPESTLLLTRLMARQGQLERAAREGPLALDLPGSPLELQAHRLLELSAEERKYLEVCAIQGVSFEPQATARILGLSEAEGWRCLLRLESVHGLVSRTEGGASFAQPGMRTIWDASGCWGMPCWRWPISPRGRPGGRPPSSPRPRGGSGTNRSPGGGQRRSTSSATSCCAPWAISPRPPTRSRKLTTW
ncbi:MAG: serine/threonine-protein kinase [Planctomycetota bacterium]